MNQRESGVLLHISSLPGPYGIGVFGQEAKDFVDRLAAGGFKAWQVLPFSITDEYNSPYKSTSAFAGNPLFIDPSKLYEKGLITGAELNACRLENPGFVDFKALRKPRLALLAKAAHRCNEEQQQAIDQWAEAQGWVKDFALFAALMEEQEGNWQTWPAPLRDRDPAALKEAETRLGARIRELVFLQYEFFAQWEELHSYARSKGIAIIGDMPIYVSDDGADVWLNRHLFELNEAGYPIRVAGVPPDFFSATGQRWGNPLYRWSEMEKEDYRWWIARLKHATRMYDRVRIDHFRGFAAYWAVDAEEETALNGCWEPGPGMKLFDRVFKEIDPAAVIAEDLGVRDQSLEDLLEQSGLPHMRVLQFAFPAQDQGMHLPYRYTEKTVAYSGTHDNNTLLAYLWELTPEERQECLDYCGYTGENWRDGGAQNPAIFAVLRTLWASNAGLVVAPIQDLLGYGGDTKMNRPGVAAGNWSFRLVNDALNQFDPAPYAKLNFLYGR